MDAEVVYGPPGTGKTTYLKGVIETEAKAANNIVVVSHTKAASAEIAERVAGMDHAGTVRAGTVHSFAFGLAGCKRGSVVDFIKLAAFAKIVGVPISARGITEADDIGQNEVGDEYLAVLSLSRSKQEDAEKAWENSHRPGHLEEFLYFIEAYRNWKETHGYYDFSDMLEMARGRDIPGMDVLIVDEGQDLSPAQWGLVWHWAGKAQRVYVAGDDDQAIYVWGGADPEGLQDFEYNFKAKRTILGQSYRIPRSVHGLASSIIGNVRGRVDKRYNPRDEIGTVVRVDNFFQVRLNPEESTLILYRNHSLRKDAEEWLLDTRTPHVFDNGGRSILQSDLAVAARDWERGTPFNLLTPVGRGALNRVYTAREIRDFEISGEWPATDPLKLGRWPWRMRDFLVALRKRMGQIPHPEECVVRLSSIHGAKGREADHVVLINGVSGKSMQSWENDQDAERRVFYVGVTRAKHRLTIVQGENALPIL